MKKYIIVSSTNGFSYDFQTFENIDLFNDISTHMSKSNLYTYVKCYTIDHTKDYVKNMMEFINETIRELLKNSKFSNLVACFNGINSAGCFTFYFRYTVSDYIGDNPIIAAISSQGLIDTMRIISKGTGFTIKPLDNNMVDWEISW